MFLVGMGIPWEQAHVCKKATNDTLRHMPFLGMEIMCLFLKEGKSCKFSQMEKFVEEIQLL